MNPRSEILHDCVDWSRVLPNKRLCKHVAKLLLTIDREKASEILRRIDTEKDVWQFKHIQNKKRMRLTMC